MNNQKLREEFEAWARDVLGWEEDEFRLVDGGGYYWGTTGEAWIVWQASRAALVIDLSLASIEASHGCHGNEENVFRAAQEAIEAAGVRVRT